MESSAMKRIAKALNLAQTRARKSCEGMEPLFRRNVYASVYRSWLDTILLHMFPGSDVLRGQYNCLKVRATKNCCLIAMARTDAEIRPSKRTVKFDSQPYLFEDMERERLALNQMQTGLISYVLEEERVIAARLFSRNNDFEPVMIPLEDISAIHDDELSMVEDYDILAKNVEARLV